MRHEPNLRNERLAEVDTAIKGLREAITCLRKSKSILNQVGVMQMSSEISAAHRAEVDSRIIDLCRRAGHGPSGAILALYAVFFPPFYKEGESIPQAASEPLVVSSAKWSIGIIGDYQHVLAEEYGIKGRTMKLRVYNK